MSTVGDIGYVDEDGLCVSHRSSRVHDHFRRRQHLPAGMRELLVTHPKVADAAVFGVPNEDLGEEVKAVVQPMPDLSARTRARGGTDRLLPRASGPSNARVRSISKRNFACRPASSTSSRCASAIGKATRAGFCEQGKLPR